MIQTTIGWCRYDITLILFPQEVKSMGEILLALLGCALKIGEILKQEEFDEEE